jgi:hypothetical protein
VRRWPWLLLPVIVFALGGCQRGCLSNWLAERGLGPAPPGGTAVTNGPVSLSGVDCFDGLARCQAGVIEVSRAYHYPDPCNGPPESCRCPWERVDDCPAGCAADGVELVVPRERARLQLCAPLPSENIARPSGDAASVAPCEGTFRCNGATIVACGPPPAAVATCEKGCAAEGESLDDDMGASAAAALLCAR